MSQQSSILSHFGANLICGSEAPKKPRKQRPKFMRASAVKEYSIDEIRQLAEERGVDYVK